MSKKKDLEIGLNGMLWMSMITVVNYLVQLISTYFLARLLTPGDFGEFAAINILVGFSELFWMMGVGPGIVQKKVLVEEDIITGHTLNILFGATIFIIINLSIHPLLDIFKISSINVLRVFSFIFLIDSISGVSQSLIQKKCKFKLLSLINCVGILSYGISAVIFAVTNFGIWSLVLAKLIQAVITAIILLKLEPVKFKFKIYKNSLKELLYFGLGYTLAQVFNYMATNGDYYVVNKTMDKIALGSYTKAYQLLMCPVNFIGTTLDQVLFPLLSKSQDNIEKLKNVFIHVTGLIALMSVPVSIVAYFSADDLVTFFLGNQWGNSILPFKILIIGLFFRIGYKLSDSLIRAIGKVYNRAAVQIIYAFMVIASAYIGHFYGLPGVAFGVSISFILNYFFLTGLSMHFFHVRISELIVSFIPSLFYGIITAVITYFIAGIITTSSHILNLVIVTLFVFVIYGTLFVLTRKRILSKDLNTMVEDIVSQVTHKFKKH